MSADFVNEISGSQDDIRLLAESAQAFAKRRLAVADLRRTGETIDRALWAEMAGMGWMSIAVSEADGGFGLGPNALTGQVGQGGKLGPEVSLLKIWGTETFQAISEMIVDCAGPAGMIEGPTEIGGTPFDVLSAFYNARPSTICGGTNEIQRNIIATAVLGLPSA